MWLLRHREERQCQHKSSVKGRCCVCSFCVFLLIHQLKTEPGVWCLGSIRANISLLLRLYIHSFCNGRVTSISKLFAKGNYSSSQLCNGWTSPLYFNLKYNWRRESRSSLLNLNGLALPAQTERLSALSGRKAEGLLRCCQALTSSFFNFCCVSVDPLFIFTSLKAWKAAENRQPVWPRSDSCGNLIVLNGQQEKLFKKCK